MALYYIERFYSNFHIFILFSHYLCLQICLPLNEQIDAKPLIDDMTPPPPPPPPIKKVIANFPNLIWQFANIVTGEKTWVHNFEQVRKFESNYD